jgi:hypothetical protein
MELTHDAVQFQAGAPAPRIIQQVKRVEEGKR